MTKSDLSSNAYLGSTLKNQYNSMCYLSKNEKSCDNLNK